jgi:hypothetical protein
MPLGKGALAGDAVAMSICFQVSGFGDFNGAHHQLTSGVHHFHIVLVGT